VDLTTTIAIDGPAASGKSTVGKALAERLGYLLFDTGVMYRAATLAALERGMDPGDEPGVTSVAESATIDIKPPTERDGRLYTVLLDSKDVTWEIRTPAVDANVSQVSTYAGVRRALTQQQRRIGASGNVVMVGRDIGTVVLPEAGIKIYLDASVEERARRRWLEVCERDAPDAQPYKAILKAMRQRDRIDSTRAIAPLRPADNAVVIDTTQMQMSEVVETVYAYILKVQRKAEQ
jgi:cytidylate kinase